jgi:hypothetical protein
MTMPDSTPEIVGPVSIDLVKAALDEARRMYAERATTPPGLLRRKQAAPPPAPTGFEPLPLDACYEIIFDLQRKRNGVEREASIVLAYRPGGTCLGSPAVFRQQVEHVAEREDHYIILNLAGQPSPRQSRQPQAADWAEIDARQLAAWWWRPVDSTCWHIGQPWPEPLPVDDETAALPLDRRTVRRIMAVHSQYWRDEVAGPGRITVALYFAPDDGRLLGHASPIGTPADHCIAIDSGDEPEDVEQYLRRLATTPLGRVVVLASPTP